MNHYELLGVSQTSDVADIRQAYLAAARRHHPDFHANADASTRAGNAQRMQQINEAWQVLSDAGARSAYDRALSVGLDPGVARRASREPTPPPGKGWTPRLGDDGWMEDFDRWADDEELPPDVPRSAGHNLVTVAPVVLFGLAVVSVFVGLAVKVQALVALGAVFVIISAGLFIMLPMFEMTRGRRR